MHVTDIVMTVNSIYPNEVTTEGRAQPITRLGCKEEMLPLALMAVIARPRKVASVQTRSPTRRQKHFYPQIGSERGIVKEIVFNGYLLRRDLTQYA